MEFTKKIITEDHFKTWVTAKCLRILGTYFGVVNINFKIVIGIILQSPYLFRFFIKI